MRTAEGVPADALPEDDDLKDLLVSDDGGRVVLTLKGRLLANEVALRLRQPGATAGSSIT